MSTTTSLLPSEKRSALPPTGEAGAFPSCVPELLEIPVDISNSPRDSSDDSLISVQDRVPGFASRLFRCTLLIASMVATSMLMSWSWLTPIAYLSTWIALSLFFVLVARASPGYAFLRGFLVGGCALGISFYWAPATIAHCLDIPIAYGCGVFSLMLVWEAIAWGVMAGLTAWQLSKPSKNLWVIPCVWVALEHFWPKIFPWALAHSQTDFLPMIQIADLFGAGGVSFCLISFTLIPAALIASFRNRYATHESSKVIRYALISTVLLLLALGYGVERKRYWSHASAANDSIRTAIVQVDPGYVDSLSKMRQLTQSVQEGVELVCWPESSLGVYSLQLPAFADSSYVRQNSHPPYVDESQMMGLRCPLLVGGKSYRPGTGDDGPFFQTAFLVTPEGEIKGRYMKRTLLPIGEYIPGQQYFPALRQWANVSEILECGSDAKPLLLPGKGKIGTVICYEDTMQGNARETVLHGARALFGLSNASDFENPVALEQHMRLSLLRAVENRRYFTRCTATGVSCAITPTGSFFTRLPSGTEGAFVVDVKLIDRLTIYTRWGYLFPELCLAMVMIVTIRSGLGVRRCIAAFQGFKSGKSRSIRP